MGDSCLKSRFLGFVFLGGASYLLGVDDLEPLLHLAALVAPALLVGHQRDVGVLGDALLAVATVQAAPVLLVT